MSNSIPISALMNPLSETLIESTVAGGAGYLCARIFMSINPVHAAVVSAISLAVSKVARGLFDVLFNNVNSNFASRLVGNILNITTCAALSVSMANALGYGISMTSFLVLNAIMISSFALVSIGILAGAALVG